MKRYIALALSTTVALGCSTTPYTGEKESVTALGGGVTVTERETRAMLATGGLAGTESLTTEFKGKVTGIDEGTRTLSIVTLDGENVSIKAGPEVRNFAQIRTGDTVRIAYAESVEFEVRSPTPEEVLASERGAIIGGRAAKGENPAGVLARGGVSILTVESIDTANALLVLKRGEELVTVRAKYPENLKTMKVGNTVVVKVAEAVAATVTPMM